MKTTYELGGIESDARALRRQKQSTVLSRDRNRKNCEQLIVDCVHRVQRKNSNTRQHARLPVSRPRCSANAGEWCTLWAAGRMCSAPPWRAPA
eukprot:623344-Pleurochrysis_carterae.AAC.6